jgi:hypothetical protein
LGRPRHRLETGSPEPFPDILAKVESNGCELRTGYRSEKEDLCIAPMHFSGVTGKPKRLLSETG